MSLETYTGYIPALVDENPTATDPKSEGDDHLRGIKKTLSDTFVGFTEVNQGVTVTASDINAVCTGGAASAMPTGMVASFAMAAPPTGWLVCWGSAVSRTTYADLFAVIGTTFGAGDGSTTFNLPDTRGYFVRGTNDSAFGDPAGPDYGRVFGSAQADDNKDHDHATVVQPHAHTATNAGDHAHDIGSNLQGGSGGVVASAIAGTDGQMATAGDHTHPISTAVVDVAISNQGTESRPFNLALNYYIKS